MQESSFNGNIFEYIFIRVLNYLLILFTLRIATPWAVVNMKKWEIRNQVIDGRTLVFTGKAMNLFARWLSWLLLTIITLGIYGFWARINILKWTAKHTHFSN